MFRRSHPEPLLTRAEVDGALAMLMQIDQRVEAIWDFLDLEEDDDGEEEAEEDA